MEDLRSNQKIYEDFPGIGIWYNKDMDIWGLSLHMGDLSPTDSFFWENWGFEHL